MTELNATVVIEGLLRATADDATPIIRRLARNQARVFLDSRAGDAGEVDQTKADYCPGYCARGEPHNGPHDPIVLNRQSGGQTAEVLNATPAPAVDAVPAGEVEQ
ncbi:hypothetical protein V3I01_08255 [Sphingomonas sp. gentR]|uniref:hypothetical protein n=1 Tax=Sphingomonas sp. gentR TaxID=3118768 RepID=UPI0030CB66BA